MVTPPQEPSEKQTNRSNGRGGGYWKRTAAFATSFGTAVAMTLGGAMPATAENGEHRSHAKAELINADLLGLNLADVGSAEHYIPSDIPGPVTGQIDAEILELVNLNLPGIELDLPILRDEANLGAVHNYAHSNSPTQSLSASGVITEDGAINVQPGDAAYDYASVDLTGALAALELDLTGVVDELSLNLGAVASQAQVDPDLTGGEPVGEAVVAGGELVLEAPLLGNLTTALTPAVESVDTTLSGLLGDESVLNDVLTGLVDLDVGPIANIDLNDPELDQPTVSVNVPELQDILEDATVPENEDLATTVNLQDGTIRVDLAKLHDQGFDQLDPNTELLSSAQISQITEELFGTENESGEVEPGILDSIVGDVVDRVLHETTVQINLEGDLEVLGLGIPPLPSVLDGAVDIGINLSIGQLVGSPEAAPINQADITLDFKEFNLLGLIDLSVIVNAVADPLEDALRLLLPTALSPVGELLNSDNGLSAIQDELLVPAFSALEPVFEGLNDVVSVTANAQTNPSENDPFFTVSAVRVDVFGSNAVSLPLATSSVYAENLEDYDPVIDVVPNPAEIGGEVTIDGRGYVPNTTVTVTITDAEDNVVYDNDTVDVGGDGAFEDVWAVDENVAIGDYTVNATDNDNPEITATDTLAIYNPTVEVEPNAAQADDQVDISGAGFASESGLTIDIYDANDVQVGAVEDVSTDAEGNFTTPWTIPTDTDAGELTVTVTDSEGLSDNQTLDVYAPTVSPELLSQTAGESVELTGDGFVPNSALTVEIAGADGVIASIEDVAVNDAGTFAEDWTIPAGTEPGELTVTASDNANDLIFASGNLTVEEPADDDADGVDTDAADTDAADADADATDADADATDADADAVDTDATDATDTDAADTDATDADATDAADTDAADADAADADATDADATDATDGGDEEPVYSGDVSVVPSDVEAGNPVTVNGEDFAPNSVVDIVITDAEGNEIGTIEGVEADDNGGFSIDWDVPADTEAGTYTVTATDTEDPEISGSADLTVTESNDADSDADTTDGVDADAADTDAVDTDGTDADSDAADADATDADADVTDGADADSDVADADADATDATDATDTDAADADAVDTDAVDTDATDVADTDGTDVDAADTDTDATEADADATDGDDDAADYSATVSVLPSDVEAGDSVTISGEDFVPNSVVNIVITDADGNDIATIEDVEVNENGEFREQWEVPADIAPGTYTVTATDTANEDISAYDELTVSDASAADAGATDGDDADETDPSINVDPDTAAPGEEVTIEGDDFGPEETVTIEITDEDGNVVDTITVVTDDNGDFSVTWTVPQDVAPGTLTITAADESGNSATAELTISAATVGAGGSDSGDALASTGAKATMIATAIALLLIVIGAGLLIARRNNTVNDAS